MDPQIFNKILALQDAARLDPDCQRLSREYAAINQQLLAQMDTMSEAQRSAVLDYIGLCAEVHMRQLALALEYKDGKL